MKDPKAWLILDAGDGLGFVCCTPRCRSLSLRKRSSILPRNCAWPTLADKVQKQQIQRVMDLFLTTLRRERQRLDCRLHFIEPGERLFEALNI